MVETKDHFVQRLSGLQRKHAKSGVYTRVDNNGVLIIKAKRSRFYFPYKGLALLVVSFFVLKAFMLSVNGPDTYGDRLAILENGTIVEAMGAKLLGVDAATQMLADKIGPLLR